MTLNEGAGARCLIGIGAIRCLSSGSGPGVSGKRGESFAFASTFSCSSLVCSASPYESDSESDDFSLSSGFELASGTTFSTDSPILEISCKIS
jgi:hypothetical protein